jgi:AraC family transcriptional regulator of adaptative response / DNA-3-methyladenine glycosylase II
MIGGLSQATCYRAVREKNKQYDGLFYFATKTSQIYCRPSCPDVHVLQNCYFFDTNAKAEADGYQACGHCRPDRLKNGLSKEIISSINDGAINDKGVHGLAESLHISERHLRRIVQDRTGMSPHHLNKVKRLAIAKQQITETSLPITDIAFNADFSSLRQFNAVFKDAFKTSPRSMRKGTLPTSAPPDDPIILPLRLLYTALLRVSLRH